MHVLEPFVTLRQAADALGVPYWKIQRAARRDEFPVYRPFNSRPLVRLSEVNAAIEASKPGGAR